MDNLPEILVHTLEVVSSHQKLAQWNITSNGNVINVSMRFVKAGHNEPSSPMSTGGRKNASRLQRDTERHHAFKAAQMNTPYHPATYNVNRKINFDENSESENHPSMTGMATSGMDKSITVTLSDQGPVPQHDDKDSHVGHSSEVPNINSKQTSADPCSNMSERQFNGNQSAQSGKIVMTVDSDPLQDEASSPYDPGQYFVKVVADFRMTVDDTAMRGLTPEGAIVSLTNGKDHDNFVVLYRTMDTYVQYDETYRWINSFYDQRYSSSWTKNVQALCAGWKQYCDKHKVT